MALEHAVRDLHAFVLHEVVGAEVDLVLTVAEHVVRGGEDRRGDGHDRLLRPAARLEAEELRVQVVAEPAGCGASAPAA